MRFLIAFSKQEEAEGFLFDFKDYADYRCQISLIGVGDAHSTEFQLSKIYNDELYPFSREITKPVNHTVNVHTDGNLTLTDVNYKTGIIKFLSPPAIGVNITADFEFDVPVRFSLDNFEYKFKNDGSIELADFELVEVVE